MSASSEAFVSGLESPTQPGAHPRAGIRSVGVGFALHNALCNALHSALALAPGACMLRGLAVAAGMSTAQAHRHLVSFQRMELVVQAPFSTRHDLGHATLRLGDVMPLLALATGRCFATFMDSAGRNAHLCHHFRHHLHHHP